MEEGFEGVVEIDEEEIKSKIDEVKLGQLASVMMSEKQIADYFGVDEDYIYDNYSALIKKKQQEGNAALRTWQFDHAQKGDPDMLKWLGKQYLGQKD